jgi:large subunit ribosomal protein L11
MAKEITNTFKVQIMAGKANPAPPLGPVLGQNGINIQEFCSQFNAKTAGEGPVEIPVIVTVFKDRTFKMEYKQPTVAGMLKAKYKLDKGSGTPNKDKVKTVKKSELREIAEKKLPDFNTKNVESALNTVVGVAKSLGIEVTE